MLFSLIPLGFSANAMGGAGGPLAVYFVAIAAAESGKLVSKETRVDVLVTPIVTTLSGVFVASVIAAPIGAAASAVGDFIKWATVLEPFWMGILVSVAVGMALTLPISSAAICAALGLTGLAGGAAVSSGMGTCGFVGQIGVYTGWLSDVTAGTKAAITPADWAGLILICFVLPALLSWIFCRILRKWNWIRENDLKLDL